MKQYYFPSGIPVTDFDATPWIRALEITYAILLVGAIGVFIWRCFRTVSLWDVGGWMLFVAAECLLALGAVHYFQSVKDRFSPWEVWTPPLLWAIGLAIIALNVTVLRYLNHLGENTVLLILEVFLIAWLALPTVGPHPPEASYRTRCKSNLKQLGLALHNYHDFYNAFPAAGGIAPDGKQLWSWRIAILPFADEVALYKAFHHDELWNSAHNLTLQGKRPDVYRCRSQATPQPFTAYAMLRGPNTIGGDGITIVKPDDITDGTSNTIFIVECSGREIIWTEPKDVEVTDDSLGVNLPGAKPGRSRGIVSSHHNGGGHVVLADGSVRFVSEKTGPSVLKSLTTINGGETVPDF